MIGLVLWAMGHRAMVEFDGVPKLLEIPGRWRLDNDSARPLAPGDKVTVMDDSGDLRLTKLLPRRNEFTRRLPGSKRPLPQTMAANIDRVVVFASAMNPETPDGLIDRLLVTAALGDVPSVLLVNKIDLATPERLNYMRRVYKNAVSEIHFTSAVDGDGIVRITRSVQGKITLFAGSSGVGKSSIANRIDPELNLKIGEISGYSGKGRHITSVGELHRIKVGGWIVDTPGLRECMPWNMTAGKLRWCFKEFLQAHGKCRFRDCMHHYEVGCAVKELVGSEALTEERYNSYLKLLSEVVPERDYRKGNN